MRALGSYNETVSLLNRVIGEKKTRAGTLDLGRAREELVRLEAVQTRHESPVRDLCERYEKLLSEKNELADEKERLRGELSVLNASLLSEYGQGLNNYLLSFGADFTIVLDEAPSQVGGRPSTSYRLLINDQAVELGDANTLPGTPCFRNTLSDGDRRTLAFAFFLAKLERDTRLGEKCVVLDDPLSSLDRHRKWHALDRILELSKKAGQVLLLSHDPDLCYECLEEAKKSGIDAKGLCISRTGRRNSAIREWDANLATMTEYKKNNLTLKDYLDHGASEDLNTVARRIRPVLEGALRSRFLAEFPPSETLGGMIGRIKAAQPGDRLASMPETQVTTLETLNRFSSRFHHETNPARYNSERTQDDELRPYVETALEFVRWSRGPFSGAASRAQVAS